MKVLLSDSLSEAGLKIFQETPDIKVDVNTELTPEELKGIIGHYHALVIRSATRVTAEIIEVAHNLKVIGRAGIGLDNIDIPAASKKGIIVMNTPEGNTITTAEHTIGMIMALSRNIPRQQHLLRRENGKRKNSRAGSSLTKPLGLSESGV